MKKICILGSTGSIGLQALDVIRRHPGKFAVTALSTHSSVDRLKKQIFEFRPAYACVSGGTQAAALVKWARSKKLKTRVLCGIDGLIETASRSGADIVLSAVVGSVGIKPLISAIRAGKTIALANKEALVVAGDIVMREAARRKVPVLPVDSEHSAIFQCLKNECSSSARRILLTASGGPFYKSRKSHSRITLSDALAHPTWDMGPKITIDSATLMNKGLEAIEAHHLFGVPLKNIEIIIHPQSIVHSMVEFADSSVIAQLSNPDMRLPIQYALTYPDRLPSAVKPLDLVRARSLEFAKPDFRRFPCLKLALDAGKKGGTAPAAMNAANETAVRAFLEKRIRFGRIPEIISKVMRAHRNTRNPSLNKILDTDAWARSEALRLI